MTISKRYDHPDFADTTIMTISKRYYNPDFADPIIITEGSANGLRRVQYDCSEPLITDQSSQKESDINNIMKQYGITGMLPNITIPGEYRDNSNTPTLEAAYDIVNAANEAFFQLPPNIRKLMDNQPSQLENFIADPNNADLLKKHGILISKNEVPVSTLTKPVTTEPVVITEKTKKTE